MSKKLTPELKAKLIESALTFLQRSGTMITVASFWIGSSQVMKRGLHTLSQNPSSSQWFNRGSTSKFINWYCFTWYILCSCPFPLYLASRWISLKDDIQADFVASEIDVHGVVFLTRGRRWTLSVTAKLCRNCDGPFRTSGPGCLLLQYFNTIFNTEWFGVWYTRL